VSLAISPNELDVEPSSVLKIECGWCISAAICAEPTCSTVLTWQNAMEDGDEAFRVKSCTCGENDFYTLCCSAHKNTFVCNHCCDTSEESADQASASEAPQEATKAQTPPATPDPKKAKRTESD
jgi:hypothetical protein